MKDKLLSATEWLLTKIQKVADAIFPPVIFLITASLLFTGKEAEAAAWLVAYVLVGISREFQKIRENGFTVKSTVEVNLDELPDAVKEKLKKELHD